MFILFIFFFIKKFYLILFYFINFINFILLIKTFYFINFRQLTEQHIASCLFSV